MIVVHHLNDSRSPRILWLQAFTGCRNALERGGPYRFDK